MKQERELEESMQKWYNDKRKSWVVLVSWSENGQTKTNRMTIHDAENEDDAKSRAKRIYENLGYSSVKAVSASQQ